MNWFNVLLASVDPTQSPEFQNWFGKSQAVDAQGKPLVLYHGTTQQFTRFNKVNQFMLYLSYRELQAEFPTSSFLHQHSACD
jgi:hypothetical protein